MKEDSPGENGLCPDNPVAPGFCEGGASPGENGLCPDNPVELQGSVKEELHLVKMAYVQTIQHPGFCEGELPLKMVYVRHPVDSRVL